MDKDKKCSDLIGKFESEEDVEICSVLSKGMYLIYAFYNHEQASEPKLDKFYVKVSSNFNFKLELMNFDTNCELLRFILLCNIINDNMVEIEITSSMVEIEGKYTAQIDILS